MANGNGGASRAQGQGGAGAAQALMDELDKLKVELERLQDAWTELLAVLKVVEAQSRSAKKDAPMPLRPALLN